MRLEPQRLDGQVALSLSVHNRHGWPCGAEVDEEGVMTICSLIGPVGYPEESVLCIVAAAEKKTRTPDHLKYPRKV